jgi:hypothetical protein
MTLHSRISILLAFLFLSTFAYGQRAGIISSEFQLSGIMEEERIVWRTSKGEVYLDKGEGELVGFIYIDDLTMVESPESFEEGKEKGQRKFIKFSCQLPLTRVIENNNELVKTREEVVVEYGDETTNVFFDMNILSLQRQGFSVVMQGSVSLEEIDVEALNALDEDLLIIWTIIGI